MVQSFITINLIVRPWYTTTGEKVMHTFIKHTLTTTALVAMISMQCVQAYADNAKDHPVVYGPPGQHKALLNAKISHSPIHIKNLAGKATPMDGTGPGGGIAPAQLSHFYGFDQIKFANGTIVGDGKGQTIAIIDAYDQPNIVNDLA